MELTEILPVEDWIHFEKELHDRFNLNCTVYNTSGIGITGNPNFCNDLCPKIKANKESLAMICAAGNQNFMVQAQKSKSPVIGECDAGLIKIAVPIFIDGEFLGTAGGCGRLLENGEVETFIIEKSTGLTEDEILELCRGLVPMTENQAQEVADFIEKRITQYVDHYVKQLSASG
jgi:ligand-binding sensor protein